MHKPGQKGIVIIGGGRLQQHLVAAAKNKKYHVILVDGNAEAECRPLADDFVNVSTKNYSEIIHQLKKISHPFHICATIGTDMSRSVAAVNEAFQLSGITISQALVTTHKGKMRDFLKKAGILQPNYIYSKNVLDLHRFILDQQAAGKNFVIKPVENMGARGVMKIHDHHDLSFAFEFAAKFSQDGEVIVEEYIEADEISIDVLVHNGQPFLCGTADRIIESSENRFFIETGHNMPAKNFVKIEERLLPILQKICDALSAQGINGRKYQGALKGDIRITGDKIYIGEIAARLSGGLMSSHTYPLATGNPLAEGLLDILDFKLPEFITQKRNSVYNRSVVERAVIVPAGKITRLETTPQIKDLASCDFLPLADSHLFVNKKLGDIVSFLQNNIGKCANIIASGANLEAAVERAELIRQNLMITSEAAVLTQKEIDSQARNNFNKEVCWVCKVCDGYNCASSVPGMGAIMPMQTFYANYEQLQKIQIVGRYLREEAEIDSAEDFRFKFLGSLASWPILTAPITGSQTNLGGATTEWDHAFEIAAACKILGIIPTFGDGATIDKYMIGFKVRQHFQDGFSVLKPLADLHELRRRIQQAEEMGARAWGMDIDGVNFKTMRMKNQATSIKTIEDLQFLAAASSLPFFLKGIMTREDAELAIRSGASAIVVSNHGGRVADSLPATCQVLPEIANFVRKYHPTIKILVDGGIRSGTDIFKMLALGADAVLIGRPVAIAAVAYGRAGVISLLHRYIQEFLHTARALGVRKITQIDRRFLY